MKVLTQITHRFCVVCNLIQNYSFPSQDTIDINVPYHQAKPGDCGIGCVAMILDWFRIQTDVTSLNKKYCSTDYYLSKTGWKHQGLVQILKDYQISATSYKFITLKFLVAQLRQGRPLIVSLQVPEIDNLDEKNYQKIDSSLPSTGHLCLLKGIINQSLILHDPRNIKGYGPNLKINIRDFIPYYTGRCICINDSIPTNKPKR